MVTAWSAQIADATAEASAAHDDAISVDQWEQAVQDLHADFATIHPD